MWSPIRTIRCPAKAVAALLAASLLVLATPEGALAGNPDDISVNRLSSVPSVERQSAFDFVVRELSMSISPHPTWSVGSLGLYEFEVSFDNRLAFVHAGPLGGDGSAPWQDMTEGGDPSNVQWIPTLRVRKGLPFSFEVGGDVGWHAGTAQMLIGGYGRLAFLDGWKRIPDAAIQLRYTGYVGNDQLELGVFETDLSVGYTFLMPGLSGHPDMFFSPFAGYGFLMSHAKPLAVSVDSVIGVSAWSDEASAEVDPRMFRFHRLFGGIELGGNRLQFRFSADINLARNGPSLGSLQMGLAIRY
jgi:hypothetical protein